MSTPFFKSLHWPLLAENGLSFLLFSGDLNVRYWGKRTFNTCSELRPIPTVRYTVESGH